MLHVTDRQSLNFQFGAFTVLLFHPVVFLALIHSCTGQSQLIGPSQPIVALVGDDIILPCHLDPAMNAFDKTVEWARPDLDPRFVVVWRDGVELESKKHPSYRGRTSVFTDELKHGNVSLKLSNVRRSDEATYRCFIPAIGRALTVQLVVGAVSSPVIQTTKTMSEVVLQCESAGWHPEPEVLWLDAEGNLLSAGPTETLRGPDDLYTVSSNVTVYKRHGNNFTCRVHQKNINQTRETHVLVPDHFFMVPSTPTTPSTPSTPTTPSTPVTPGSQQVIIGSVIGCAALVLIAAAAVFVMWKQRRKKFKNKRRSHEDGPEQTEAETMVTCRSDNTGFQVVVEGEEERVPLMAGSEGQNNVDNRGEEKISQSHSEHEDPQVGAERETHQNQLVTKPDMDRTGEGREVKSIKNEEIPLIATEGGNHQEQDMTGRQVLRDRGEGGVEQKMKPVKEDSGLPVAEEAEGQKEQPQNVHSDQDVQTKDKKEKREKQKKARKKNKNVQVTKGGSGSVGRKKENQREGMEPEAETQRAENKKLQSETQKREKIDKDKTELKPQKGNCCQQLVEDKKMEGSEAELEDKKEKAWEGNQSSIMRTTERKGQNQTEKLIEREDKRVENEGEFQLQRQDDIRRDKDRIQLKTQKGDGKQHFLDAKRETQHEDEIRKDQEGKQSDTTVAERKTESHKVQINDKLKETKNKRGESENMLQSVNREVTVMPNFNIHQEPARTIKQEENKLQAEKHQEDKSERNQEETLQQPEKSTKEGGAECEERQEERMETDEGVYIDETQNRSKEINQRGQQHEIRKQPKEIFRLLTGSEVNGQKVSQEEDMEIDTRSQSQRNVKTRIKQRKQAKEPDVRKMRYWREDTVKTGKTLQELKVCLGKQNLKEHLKKQKQEKYLQKIKLKDHLRKQKLKGCLKEQKVKQCLGRQKLKEDLVKDNRKEHLKKQKQEKYLEKIKLREHLRKQKLKECLKDRRLKNLRKQKLEERLKEQKVTQCPEEQNKEQMEF